MFFTKLKQGYYAPTDEDYKEVMRITDFEKLYSNLLDQAVNAHFGYPRADSIKKVTYDPDLVFINTFFLFSTEDLKQYEMRTILLAISEFLYCENPSGDLEIGILWSKREKGKYELKLKFCFEM